MSKVRLLFFLVVLVVVLWVSSQFMGAMASQGGSKLAAALHLGASLDDSYPMAGAPTISAEFTNRVFAAYGSPAVGTGQQLYDLGVQYGIDPVYALAFFLHEDSFGKT
jgi:hypothetical protein